MGSYIEICFASLINFLMFTTKGDIHDYGVMFNNIYMVLSSVLLVAFPCWLFCFLRKNYFDLHFREFRDKYETIYLNMQLYDNEYAIWLPIVYCLRRAALAATCCCLIGYPVFQFLSLFATQTICLIYLGHAKPYETRYELRVEYFNETMIFVLIYHLILFTKEYIELVDIRHYVGISLIFFTLLLLLVNLVLIAIPSLNTLRLKARRWMNIKKMREKIRVKESSPEYIAKRRWEKMLEQSR